MKARFILRNKRNCNNSSDVLTDYRIYKFTYKEYALYFLIWLIVISVISISFYSSFIPLVVFTPTLFLYYRQLSKYLCSKRQDELCRQFKDTLMALASSLESGFSMENAIWDSYIQISTMYSKNCHMAKELYAIHNQIQVSVSIENAFSNFARRTDIEDIHIFCDILKIAKRTGGNITEIIVSTSETISEKFDMKREIKSNLDSKRFEQFIMLLMPFIIIIYLRFSSPGFFSPLYKNPIGITISSLCLVVYSFAIFLTLKITDIKP